MFSKRAFLDSYKKEYKKKENKKTEVVFYQK